MLVFKNLGKKPINSTGTIIFDSRTLKKLKSEGQLLINEEVFQAIYYPNDMLINNFYAKHVLKKSRDLTFTILIVNNREPTLQEVIDLLRIVLITNWISKHSFLKGQYYEIEIPKINNNIFMVCIYNSIQRKSYELTVGLLRIDHEPKIIRIKDLPQQERGEYDKFKKSHIIHPEILFIEHLIIAPGKP